MHRTKRHKMQKPAQRILGSNQCLVAPAEFESAWQYQTLSHKFPIMLNKFCAGGSQRILKQRLSSTVTVSMALCGVCGVCGVCSLWSVVLLLALLWHMCLTMARPHQTERRKLEASNVAVTLGFGNIKVCQFCQPPRFCRLHWMALPNRHPTHQPPVISPSSAPMALCPAPWAHQRLVWTSHERWLLQRGPEQHPQDSQNIYGCTGKEHSRDLDCFVSRYFILETAHSCLKLFRFTYGGRHPSFSLPSQTGMSNTRSTAQDKGPDANCREWGGIAQGLLASDCLQGRLSCGGKYE